MVTELEEIYSAYFKDVYRFIKKLSGSEDIAEDITSETFFKAMKNLDSFRGDCDIRIWLCQIAKNLYYTKSRRTRNDESLDEMTLDLPARDIPIEVQILSRSDSRS